MAADTILIEGTDLATIATIEDMSGVLAAAPTSGDPIAIPGRAGAIFVVGEREAYSFDVPLALLGDTRGEQLTALASLEALLDTRDLPITVTRRITRGTTQVDEAALCIVASGWQPKTAGRSAIRVVVSMMNIEGEWTPTGYAS
ncbi:MAG: hypothetical protein WCF04_01005 [Candidatus Nanopelagicales bacterium]